MSGHSLKFLFMTWLKIDPPNLFFSEPKFILTNKESLSSFSMGVKDLCTSVIGANAETINDSGLVFL